MTGKGATIDVGVWLRDLGLGQYEATFRENEIDESVLQSLTAEDLKELGVAPLGHRRKLLDAISALRAGSGGNVPRHASVSTPPPTPMTTETPASQASGERRHVTVMFCDLVDSTGIAAKLDAEEWRDLVGAYLDAASAAVTEMGGKVAKKLGDGLMVLFGHPVAQENDAERTVRAGLAIQRALAELNRKNEGTGKPVLAARVAIDLGPVVIDATGEIFGDVPNVAARAQALAEPGAVVVTARVQRQVAGLFVSEECGSHALKGVPEPVMLYRIARASGGGRRAGQRHLSPLVGREEELAMRFGGADVSADQRLADLENSLTQVKLDPAENVPLLAPLLDIPLPVERTLELLPEELRRRQMAALTNWVMVGARAQPIVLAVEDAHWADPSTLDLLRGVAERGALAPLFVLITARSEFRPSWGARSHHGTISLVPLDRYQVRHMVSGLAARHALSKELVEGVTERTGGVPLFVEELTRLLLERGEQGTLQTIPPTLQQSLTARLDRLGSAREVAQIGAVIGREFPYALLSAVAAVADAPLQAALERLAEADILLVQGLPPVSEYRFKHALIQDAAYENLLKSRRQSLHRRVAETLRDQIVGLAAPVEPELLAHHFTEAGLADAAVEWWGKAGQRSVERSALVEAIEQFTRALALIATLPATPALRREEIKLQVALTIPLMHVKGYSAPDTKDAADRARLLIEQAEMRGEMIEDPLLLFSVLFGLWAANYIAFDGDAACELAGRCMARAEKQSATAPLMIGKRMIGTSLMAAGSIADSRRHLDEAVALYDPAEHRPVATRFGGVDTRVTALCYRSLAMWLLGYPDQAIADVEYALKDARESRQATSLMQALALSSITLSLCGDYATANALVDELVSLANEKATSQWMAIGMSMQGNLFALMGKTSESAQLLTSALAAHRSMGSTVNQTMSSSRLASACAKLGRLDEAERHIAETVTEMHTTKEKWYEAEVYRTASEIALLLYPPDVAKAEAFLERALAVGRQQQTRSWELRAAMSMARLWRDQGKQDEARDLLAPVYGWFTEGFDTRDLKEAKKLLDELAS
jgi:class 3 adenylate cyclase/predicted ATPase